MGVSARVDAVTLSDAERDELREYLSTSWVDDLTEVGKRDITHYVNYAFERFVVTLEYLPVSPDHVLELGSSPYFITLMMKRMRAYRLELTNYYGESNRAEWGEERIVNERFGERHTFRFKYVNVETDRFPYEDAAFDGVVYCEVLEHLTMDPVASLREIHRVLKPGGWLLLTTPNVTRYENITRLASGWGIGDQYSGYGPYGRHNREYSLEEIRSLLDGQGFDIERLDARMTLPLPGGEPLDSLRPHLGPPEMHQDNLFCLARRAGRAGGKFPRWLYRSYDAALIDFEARLTEVLPETAGVPESPELPRLREELARTTGELREAREENARHRLILRTRIVSAALWLQRWLARLRTFLN